MDLHPSDLTGYGRLCRVCGDSDTSTDASQVVNRSMVRASWLRARVTRGTGKTHQDTAQQRRQYRQHKGGKPLDVNMARDQPDSIDAHYHLLPPSLPLQSLHFGPINSISINHQLPFRSAKTKKKKLGTEINLLGSRVEKRKRIGSSQKRLLENR